MKLPFVQFFTLFIGCTVLSCNSCNDDDEITSTSAEIDTSVETVNEVNTTYFTDANTNITITKVPCTLSDGTVTECYEISTNSTPQDHQMGPWCPDNISDDASKGGIWLEGGIAHDVDGNFIKDLATFYNDSTWMMYDSNGDIYITDTEQDCINAANPNVGTAYENFCVECLPSYITNVTQTFTIPVIPVKLTTSESFLTAGGGPGGPTSTIPSTRGIALNGVEFSAPAPVSNILTAYTLAPFDDAGGHINVNQGYHYHAATGISISINQADSHSALIGYAMDGHGIYSLEDENGEEASDLDECRGHYDSTRGYHYHVDAAGNNNFINCLYGAYAE